jgi:hypothetical protein
MMPTNEKRTSFMKKALISTGVILVLGAGILLLKLVLKGPPIEVGDGTINFHYDDGGIQKNSDYDVELYKQEFPQNFSALPAKGHLQL